MSAVVGAHAMHCMQFSSTQCVFNTDNSKVNNWNTTLPSSIVSKQNPCRMSTAASHSTFDSSTERYSQFGSTDHHAPIATQSAVYTARPSGAITISPPCVHVEPQSCSVFGADPLVPEPGGSSGLLSRHASVISSQLPTGTHRLLPATTYAITQSTSGPGNLLIVGSQLVSLTGLTSALSKRPAPTMSASRPAEGSQNALSVLLAALPSDVASSIESGFSVVTKEFFPASETGTPNPTIRPTPSAFTESAIITTSRSEFTPPVSRQSNRPDSTYTARSTSQQPHSTSRPTPQHTLSHTSRPTSHPPSRTPESSQPHRPTTFLTRPLTTSTTSSHSTSSLSTSSNPASTTTAQKSLPSVTPEKQQANGTIAGVATGVAAGVVLITLAIFFFLRRRQRQRALKAIEAEASQPFPASAWLYDPSRSPPRTQSPTPETAEAGGVAGMTPAQAKRNSALAPELVLPEGEPLLAPSRAATRENSPNGANGRVRSVSPGGAAR